ncbi:PKD domain-containing protein [Chitinophaga japonensis]|uniref:PKD domain-containing protein n=1 Tax=Chitinophaga japonensis TaxID=104662 RepID=UPI0013155C23|nr:PKD domain-containing protein [Chitinophaga japonensis]
MPDSFTNLTGYYQHLPQDYAANPSKSYPLLIFVHGVGELAGAGATSLQTKVLRNGPPKLIEQGTFPASFTVNGQQFSFIVITPQFKVWPGAGDIHRLVAYLQQQLRVDASRLYVTGLSMGGGVAWGAISEVPSKAKQYAASVVVCGAYAPTQALANNIAANNTPVWALHNDGDPTVPVSNSQGWVKYINAYTPTPNPPAKLTIFNSTSHDAWSKSYDPNFRENGMNVYEWMLQYTRGTGTTPPPTTPPPATGNKRITVPPSSGRQVYYPDAMKSLNVQAGDTLCLAAGDYDYIHFGNLLGTAAKPIIIMNCGGLVRTGVNSTTTAASFVFSNSKYFKVEGTGDPSIEYGFDVNGTNRNGQKLFGFFFGNGSSDFDVHHAYVHDAGMFLQAKTLQQCGHPEWLEGAFVMRNVKIHHLLCRNSAWEGFYIGNTHYLWDNGTCQDMKSHHIENLEVYDNDLENMGSDGIQISIADIGANLVHHNRVVNYAMAKNDAHGYGILCGGGSTLRIYNNRIDKGYNCGIQIFGSGINYVYNNVVSNIHYEGINVTDKFLFQPATGYIYNNTVYNTGINGMKIYADLTTVGHKVYNNLVVAPGNQWDYPQSGFYIRGSNPIKFDTANNLSFKTADLAFFEDAAGGNVHLTNKSRAVNAGRDMKDLALALDLDDKARPQNTKYDVGAYEYNGNTNIAPVANAGADKVLSLPLSIVVQLDGSASKDPDGSISKYAWRKVSGPALGIILTPGAAQSVLTGLVEGTYVFELAVTDNSGVTTKDQVMITVLPLGGNKAPNAVAGSDVTLTLPANSTQLYGSNSLDPDGVITDYLWTQLSGPGAGVIADATASNTNLTGLVAGTYVFELTVTDNAGDTGKDQVTITVTGSGGTTNNPPVANAGTDKTITLPASSVQLDGSASRDTDGSIAKYAWKKVSGPAGETLATPAAAKTNVTGLVAGTYVFELAVTDDKGAAATDRVTVTVKAGPQNELPVADAGADFSITLPLATAHLDGSASTDPDGSITGYAWTKVSGPAGTIISPNSEETNVTGLSAGTYVFELTITDNDNAAATDRVTVTVLPANKPPVANAGANKSITLPVNSVQLDGSASSDPDGAITKYAWTKVSGPAAGAISSPAAATTGVTGLTAGTYVFELVVTDDGSASDTDRVTVVVIQPAANQPPVANAGADINVILPVNNVQLDGGASSDADGNIAAYAWKKISGPAGGVIGSPAAAATSITGLVQGTYVFQLTVTDDAGATASDRVTVTVAAAPVNDPPLANAGADISITLPVSSALLDGSASSDPDGSITAYAWTQVSGPSSATIASPGSSSTSITGLVQGFYTFELKVTDDKNATARDRVLVTVNHAANQSPVADAGANQVVQYPTDFTYIHGRDSHDPDGSIASYAWKQVSGPSQAYIWHTDWVETRVSNLKPGQYVFELTVTDDMQASSSATLKVDVLADKSTPDKDSVSMFPNPAIDFIRMVVRYMGQGTKLYFSVYDMNGKSRALFTHPLTAQLLQKDLDIHSLPAGYYMVEIRDEKNQFRWTGKFLKAGN